MRNWLLWIVLVAAAVALAWWLLFMRPEERELAEVSVVSKPAIPPRAEPPPITHPVQNIPVTPPPEPAPEPEPLPPLEDSDPAILEAAGGVISEEALAQHFVAEQIVGRMVATVDSLTSAKVAPLMLPLKPAPGKFTVLRAGDEAVISPRNAERYTPYVELLQSMDTEELLRLYVRFYPLFQESYESLGYPGHYFNDRLVEVIDHLLATPQARGMLAVAPDEANFVFADPDLEALSAGQKLLLRMGEENAAVVRARLRELRAALAGFEPPPGREDPADTARPPAGGGEPAPRTRTEPEAQPDEDPPPRD